MYRQYLLALPLLSYLTNLTFYSYPLSVKFDWSGVSI